MRIVLDSRLTPEQNAARYFERAKKAKRKLEGARKAVEMARGKLAQEQHAQRAKEEAESKPKPKKEWYEKFRWFVSSQGVLCVGGRDATTNEVIVKKHAQPGDVVFHTDMAGSPFVVVKAQGAPPADETMEEAAQFAATYSRAWKGGMGSLEVFSASPEQLSKSANPGEFMGKGAFMVRGGVRYRTVRLGLWVGREESGRIMAGPERAVLARCSSAIEVLQGNEKTSDVAKRIAKRLGAHPDDIVPLLPPGGVKMGKEAKGSHAAA